MSKTVVAFGELLWDLLPNKKVLGGAAANFIFRVNTLGDNGKLISCLGNDELGENARKEIKQLGLSEKFIQTNSKFPTGTVPVTLDERGTPDFTIIPNVAYDHIELTQHMISLVNNADCLYFGTLAQRARGSKITLHALIQETPETTKFLDINLRRNCYTTDTIDESLKLADILKLNDEELITLKELLGIKQNDLKGMASEIMYRYKLKFVLVTLANKGAFVVSTKNDYYYDAGYQVPLKDTIGSGDAFSAGFMHSYLNENTLEYSLKFGNATGAMVASTTGGTHPISKEEIIQFMQGDHKREHI